MVRYYTMVLLNNKCVPFTIELAYTLPGLFSPESNAMLLINKNNDATWRSAIKLAALCCFLLLQSLVCLAATPSLPGQPLDVTQQANLGRIRHYQLLEDASGKLRLEDMRRRTDWRSVSGQSPNFGYSTSVWWIKLELANPGAAAAALMIGLGSPLQDFVDWHVVDRSTGQLLLTALSGDRRVFEPRFQPSYKLALPLNLAAGQVVAVYARFASHDGLHESMPFRLFNAESFYAEKSREKLLFGVYLGCLLSFCIYSFFMFVSTREKIYISYTLFLAVLIINTMIYYGISAELVFPRDPDLNNLLLPATFSLCMFLFFIFSRSFLKLSEHFKRFHMKIYDGCTGLLMIASPFIFIVDYAMIYRWLSIVAIFNIVLLLGFAIRLCLQKNRDAVFFFIAFSPLGASITLKLLGMANIVTSEHLMEANFYLPQCTVFSVIALSFSLAYSVKLMRTQVRDAKSGELQSTIALQRSELKLLHLSRVTVAGELTGAIAHELSQPLTSVLSNAQAAEFMMKNRHFDPAAHLDIVLDIVSQARRATAMLAKIRKMLLPGSKTATRTSASELFGSVSSFLQHELDRQHIKLGKTCEFELLVQADVVQIQQVLINLIMNAIDAVRHLPDEHKCIHLSATPYLGKYVLFAVSDTGNGLPHNKHDEVFQAFFTTKEGGMGLGLNICKKIINAHNGQIWARSAYPHGAILEFTLPLHG